MLLKLIVFSKLKLKLYRRHKITLMIMKVVRKYDFFKRIFMIFQIFFLSEIISDNRKSIARNIPDSMSYIDGICKFINSIFLFIGYFFIILN
jgi:hypothetical protein